MIKFKTIETDFIKKLEQATSNMRGMNTERVQALLLPLYNDLVNRDEGMCLNKAEQVSTILFLRLRAHLQQNNSEGFIYSPQFSLPHCITDHLLISVRDCWNQVISRYYPDLPPLQTLPITNPNNIMRVSAPYLQTKWPLASDHLPVGIETKWESYPLKIMTWNINAEPKNDLWMHPSCPGSPLFGRGIDTFQGLDGSSTTQPFPKRIPLLLAQIKELLQACKPDILALQECNVYCVEALKTLLDKSELPYTIYANGSGLAILYQHDVFEMTEILSTTYLLRVQSLLAFHKTLQKSVTIINLHLKGAPNSAIPTPERYELSDYANQLANSSILLGDMNIPPEVLSRFLPASFKIAIPSYSTNVDPYSMTNTRLDGQREWKQVDTIALRDFPSNTRVLAPSELPECMQQALQAIAQKTGPVDTLDFNRRVAPIVIPQLP